MHGLERIPMFLAIAMVTFEHSASAQTIDDKVRIGMTVGVFDDWGDRYRGRVEQVVG